MGGVVQDSDSLHARYIHQRIVVSQSSPFGESLKRFRVAAGLSQEALAEGARLSARAISDLERGARQIPRRDTVALLAEALSLPPRSGPPWSPRSRADGEPARQPHHPR